MSLHRIIPLYLLFLILPLSGCVTGLSNLGDGRQTAWKEVKKDEEKTKQEFLKTKQEEFKASAARKTIQNPTMKLTAYGTNGEVVSIAEMDLQPVLAELGLGKRDDTYGITLAR